LPLPSTESVVVRKLDDEPHALYGIDDYLARRGVPADPSTLDGHDVVVYSDPHPAMAWCAKAYRNARVVLSSASMQVTAAAIAAGLGLGVVPARAARTLPRLRALSPPVARASGWIVVHPDLARVPRVRVVVDAIAAGMRADPTPIERP
jgi:DNA-binding transcriptional LysR family regulator